MSGAIPVLPRYAVMAWTGTSYLPNTSLEHHRYSSPPHVFDCRLAVAFVNIGAA
jgi:hypothetical protein